MRKRGKGMIWERRKWSNRGGEEEEEDEEEPRKECIDWYTYVCWFGVEQITGYVAVHEMGAKIRHTM